MTSALARTPQPLFKFRHPAIVKKQPTAAAIQRGAPVDPLARRRQQARANAAEFRRTTARFRLDQHWLPTGECEAILTITLPDGHTFRFASKVDPHDIARIMVALNPEVGGFLGDIWNGVKKVAKSVATSKVFKTATGALAAAAPLLGPLAPAALTAAGAMKGATALLAARQHEAKGNTDKAKQLVAYAAKAAKVTEKINPKPAAKPAAKGKPAAKPAAPKAAQVIDTAQQMSSKLYTLVLKPA